MTEEQLQRLFQNFPHFSIREAISRGWEMFKAQPLNTLVFSFLVLSIQGMSSYFLKDFSLLITILISPPLTGGFFLIANRISRGVNVEISDYFEGFSFWGILILTSLVSGILTFFGLLALIVPGIYLAVAFVFGIPFALFSGMDFWNSLELSRKLITRNWWKFFGFILVLVLLNVLGLLCFLVGVLVTIPVSYFAIYAVFEDLTQEALSEPEVIHGPES
jgi:hypothetical protein